nr:MAG TPA: hypothetical protein [Caudoviricetes sp.]
MFKIFHSFFFFNYLFSTSFYRFITVLLAKIL